MTEEKTPDTPQAPRLLTNEEFANILRTTTRTLFTLRKAGDMPTPVQIGRRLLWRDTDVAQYIQKQQMANA